MNQYQYVHWRNQGFSHASASIGEESEGRGTRRFEVHGLKLNADVFAGQHSILLSMFFRRYSLYHSCLLSPVSDISTCMLRFCLRSNERRSNKSCFSSGKHFSSIAFLQLHRS